MLKESVRATRHGLFCQARIVARNALRATFFQKLHCLQSVLSTVGQQLRIRFHRIYQCQMSRSSLLLTLVGGVIGAKNYPPRNRRCPINQRRARISESSPTQPEAPSDTNPQARAQWRGGASCFLLRAEILLRILLGACPRNSHLTEDEQTM